MSTPDPAPDDRPLTLTEIEENTDPLFVLADRVLTHLDGDWQARLLLAHDVMLLGPDGMKLCFTLYGDTDYDPRRFYIGTYTPTGRPSNRLDPMSIFTLPSQIAAHLESQLFPDMRRRAETAHKALIARRIRDDHRKDQIAAIARELHWNASSYKCHSRESYPSLDPRYRKRRPPGTVPVLSGNIGYDKDGSMHAYLSGLPESLVGQIVGLVADHYAPPSQRRWPRRSPQPARRLQGVPDTGTERSRRV